MFVGDLQLFRAIFPFHEKCSLSILKHFRKCSWCCGVLQSVTKTQWFTSACSLCPVLKSYIWCIKDLWYFVFSNWIQVIQYYETLRPLLSHNTISEILAKKALLNYKRRGFVAGYLVKSILKISFLPTDAHCNKRTMR